MAAAGAAADAVVAGADEKAAESAAKAAMDEMHQKWKKGVKGNKTSGDHTHHGHGHGHGGN